MGLFLRTKPGSLFSGEGRGLCGLVLLQSREVERRRGPAPPLLQLPVLEEQVAGWQGDPRLCLWLAERVGDAAVQVAGLDAVLPMQGQLSTSIVHKTTSGRHYWIEQLFYYLERLNEAQHPQRQSAAGVEELLQAGKTKGRDYHIGLFHLYKRFRSRAEGPRSYVSSFSLPFAAAELVRGDFSAHFAVELRAEEGHPEAQLQRNPLVFRGGGWKKGKVATLESPFWVYFAFKPKSFPTLCLCFALPVVVLCHELEGLRAAVGVYAPA